MMNSGRVFWMGLFFSVTTVIFWGMIPIALKLTGGFADPVTLTWARFTFAAIVVLLWQWQHGLLSEFASLNKSDWCRLLASGVFLIVNYTCFAWGVNYLSPEVAQLAMQISPLFLALGGMLFLNEKVSMKQWSCIVLLFIGLLTFFHPVVSGHYQGNVDTLAIGLVIIFFSSLTWSVYALMQKTLFNKLGANNILLAIYVLATIVMFPFAVPQKLVSMHGADIWVMLFCCVNTVIAYGAFTQAMRYWQTVQVSAVLAMTPVASFIFTQLCALAGLWSGIIHFSHADWLSIFGMCLVVFAAILVQLVSAKRVKLPIEPQKPGENEVVLSTR